MSGRLTAAAVLALTLLLALSVATGCGDEAGADDFVGKWRETDASPAATMRIASPQDGIFVVTYRRFYPSRGEFQLVDGELRYHPITPDMVDVITYDAGDDTVTITSGASGDTHTFTRVEP